MSKAQHKCQIFNIEEHHTQYFHNHKQALLLNSQQRPGMLIYLTDLHNNRPTTQTLDD